MEKIRKNIRVFIHFRNNESKANYLDDMTVYLEDPREFNEKKKSCKN